MKPFENLRHNTFGLFLCGLSAAVVIFAIWWLLTEPGRARSRAAEAGLRGRVSAAGAEAGAVAVDATAANANAAAEIDKIGRDSGRAIDQSPEAGVGVPGAAGALRAGLCQFPEHRGEPLCLRPSR